MTYESATTQRSIRNRRVTMIGAALVATALYFGYLTEQNNRARAFLTGLRQSDPALYLDELRRLDGFNAFLRAYREIRGFSNFGPQPPSFLVGRWTMRNAPVRMLPNTQSAVCPRPFMIDYGHVRITEPKDITDRASYRLSDGNMLEIRTRDHGRLSVQIVAFGSSIDYLVFTPPGADAPVYAYRCAI
ncbi:MAG: hypothetical protein KDA73_02370 [Rhodobacteraceae bacterium]|nr:hypothetical protein [Paracoccaceae bacterium]